MGEDIAEEMGYKLISVYVDKKNNLYAIPTGLNRKFNIGVDIDLLFILEPPYTDAELEAFLMDALNHCYSMENKNINDIGPLSRHLNVKSWSAAVRNKKLVTYIWGKGIGYIIKSSKKIPKKGYDHINTINLGFTPQPGETAAAFYAAVSESTI